MSLISQKLKIVVPILTNMLLLSILHIVKVLGQRGPAGGKRPAFTPAQQSPGPVLLEVVLTHWNIHVHRGSPKKTFPKRTGLYFPGEGPMHCFAVIFLMLGGREGHSAAAPREDHPVL